MIAIIDNWGKQYKVKKWDIVELEKIEVEEGKTIEIKKVLMVIDEKDESKSEVWKPFVAKTVKAKVLENWKWDKTRVFKMKSKKRYSRLYGHRQPYTKVEIVSVG